MTEETNSTNYEGQVLAIQACSTNSTGTANIKSVTTLSVGGSIVAFTNSIGSVTLADGVGSVSPTNAFVAPNQKIIVDGSAFPGGSAIIWVGGGE